MAVRAREEVKKKEAREVESLLEILSALPSGVSITVDAPTKSIVITNNTTNTVSVFIAYRIVSV